MFDQARTDRFDPESGEPPEECQYFFPAPGEDALDAPRIGSRLIAEEDHFAHLRELAPSILYLMRAVPKTKGGKPIDGEMILPRTGGGTMNELLLWFLACACRGQPDYLMVLDAAVWDAAGPLEREALVWHQLEHAGQKIDKHGEPRFTPDGTRPIFDIRAHDIEEFESVVRRAGAWKGDVASFAAALRDGGVL